MKNMRGNRESHGDSLRSQATGNSIQKFCVAIIIKCVCFVLLAGGCCLLPVACCLSKGWAWEPRPSDLEESFLLWASPRSEYSSRQQEAYQLLTTDSAASALVVPKFMGTPSGSIRDKILTFCENIGPAAVGPAFRPYAGADSPQLGLVLFCLSRSHDTESLPVILEQLKNRRWQVRSTAALSLGYLGDKRAAEELVHALETETYPMARKSIAFALGQCADSSTVTSAVLDALVGALGDDYFATRFNAARSLAGFGEPACVHLAAIYDNLTDTARYGALLALGRASTNTGRRMLEKIGADPTAALPLRGIALKGLLDQKWPPADTDLADLRNTSVGRGLFGLLR